jgi:hypothetical protein
VLGGVAERQRQPQRRMAHLTGISERVAPETAPATPPKPTRACGSCGGTLEGISKNSLFCCAEHRALSNRGKLAVRQAAGPPVGTAWPPEIEMLNRQRIDLDREHEYGGPERRQELAIEIRALTAELAAAKAAVLASEVA